MVSESVSPQQTLRLQLRIQYNIQHFILRLTYSQDLPGTVSFPEPTIG